MTIMRVGHVSLEFSDPHKQQQFDARRIFDRAVNRNYAWLSGTEAGANPLKGYVRDAAHNHDFTFAEFKSLWVAVRKDIIVPGSYSWDSETVVDNDLTVGAGHDTSLLWATFEHEQFGVMTEMVSHYPRFGRPDARDPHYRVNLKWNKKTAQAIGTHAEEEGAGSKLFFYSGDQNIPDNISDTFFGEPMTSAADELHHWEGSGHGAIDVIASYDRDGRVEAVSFNAFNDRQFFLNTDHYLIEAEFEIRRRKA